MNVIKSDKKFILFKWGICGVDVNLDYEMEALGSNHSKVFFI